VITHGDIVGTFTLNIFEVAIRSSLEQVANRLDRNVSFRRTQRRIAVSVPAVNVSASLQKQFHHFQVIVTRSIDFRRKPSRVPFRGLMLLKKG